MLNKTHNTVEKCLFERVFYLSFFFITHHLVNTLWLRASEFKKNSHLLTNADRLVGLNLNTSSDILSLHEIKNTIVDFLFLETFDDGFLLHKLFEELDVQFS